MLEPGLCGIFISNTLHTGSSRASDEDREREGERENLISPEVRAWALSERKI